MSHSQEETLGNNAKKHNVIGRDGYVSEFLVSHDYETRNTSKADTVHATQSNTKDTHTETQCEDVYSTLYQIR